MKVKVQAIAPTTYQLMSVRNFGSPVRHLANGSHIFEQEFNSEEDAKEYLIGRAELYFEEEDKLDKAIEDINLYGQVTLDAVTGHIIKNEQDN